MGIKLMFDPFLEQVLDNGVEVYPATRLRHLIGEAHAVVIAAPLTAETEGLLGTAELAECRDVWAGPRVERTHVS